MPEPSGARGSGPDAVQELCTAPDEAPRSVADLLQAFRAPGTAHYAPTAFAAWLELSVQELADMAGVHRNSIRSHPDAPRVQALLRDLMRVLSAAAQRQPDLARVAFYVKNAPVPALRHKTLLELVVEGKTEAALDYVDSVLPGFLG